ncbi:MAG: PLP-dependent cysteine synthase family protein, partial [Chloroflexi bacterium]|nr:PLP-dependent cysteine synthase family protein [Chloroflexota bacterium]
MPQSKEYLDFLSKYPPLLAIGNTPLAKVDLGLDVGEAEILAKYEHLNPGGSIKDRPVLRMLVEAVLSGKLTHGKVILDATSGNAGIAYAMIGAVLGYKVELVMPSNASEERKKRVRAHGAGIVFTDAMLGYDETLHEVRRRYEQHPEKYFWCDQYGNMNNPLAHYDTTAEEILRQAPDITHFVAGVGTGGTISGVGRRLKEHNPDIEVVVINFDEWPGVEGLKP